jgi:hypothetical protein
MSQGVPSFAITLLAMSLKERRGRDPELLGDGAGLANDDDALKNSPHRLRLHPKCVVTSRCNCFVCNKKRKWWGAVPISSLLVNNLSTRSVIAL